VSRVLIHWFRRDLRVDDNTALAAATRDGDGVVPVFVLDDRYLEGRVGPARFAFLRESLEELDRSLSRLGTPLVVLRGPAERALPELAAQVGAAGVYANAEIGPSPERRDAGARDAVERGGGLFRLYPDSLVVEPDALATQGGEPFRAYTPFARRWHAVEKRGPVSAPTKLSGPRARGVVIARVRAWRNLATAPGWPAGGEGEARRVLDRFTSRAAARYAADRDRPDVDGTSRLSPHVHFGTISPRRVLQAAGAIAGRGGREAGRSAEAFVAELAWREFFHHVLHHFPRVARESFRPGFDAAPWRDGGDALAAWKAGRTGYPFIDAGMRQLSTEHWMHNRARMAVASFLTKDLHVHWSEGETWFEHELADADLANNNGGWQWAAGTGTDAAPYFRILNPALQGKRFDPDGVYIRRFLPELTRVPAERLHEPWKMTAAEQAASACRIGVDYPAPIVEHAAERRIALGMFQGAAGLH
jgi:deoxyribodipyrimidine photo-lyase